MAGNLRRKPFFQNTKASTAEEANSTPLNIVMACCDDIGGRPPSCEPSQDSAANGKLQREKGAHQWHFRAITNAITNARYWTGTVSGQVGNPGAHNGTGLWVVADWWLGTALAEECDTEAAATPTKTTESAKMRTASFIAGNLIGSGFVQEVSSRTATE
jgi:hypothetical protein